MSKNNMTVDATAATSLPRKTVGNVRLGIWNWIASHGDYFCVLILYILLTILFTWPLAENFTSYVNGNVMDVFHEMWYLNLDYTSPYGPFFIFFTKSILYPYGVPMYFQVLSPLHALIGMPIYSLFGLIDSYNFLYMFTFFASAFTMYIFVNYLTNNKYAAFFSGIAFGFAPVHTGQGIAHLNIMASEMLPLFGYFFIKMVREQKMRNGVYAGVLIVLNAMLDLHFLLFSGILVLSFLIYYILVQRKQILNKPYIIRLFLMFVVAGLLGVVVYFQTFFGLIFAPTSLGSATASTLSVHIHRTPDLLQFLLPAPENPFFGQYTTNYFQNFLSFPQVRTYIGYSVLVLAIVGLAKYRRRKDVLFWGFLAIVGFLISLGPSIEVNGQLTELQGVWTYLYYLVPFFKSFRTPYRLDYLVAFGLAVLAGYGLTSILSAIDGWRLSRESRSRFFLVVKLLVVILLCTALIVEFLPIPYTEMNARIPQFYTQVLANDHSNYTVLDVPAYLGNDVYLYYQTAYNRPVITGHIARTPPSSLDFVQGTPFIDQLGQYLRGGGKPPADIINQSVNSFQIAPFVLAEYHIKYIIVHKDLMPPKIYARSIAFLTNSLGFPYYEDSLVTVFRYIPPSSDFGLLQYPAYSNTSLVSLLFGGWNPYGLIGRHARTMDFYAGLNVYSSSDQNIQLKFAVEGITGNYQLQFLVNGEQSGTYFIGNGTYTVITTPFVNVHKGLNQVAFNSLEGCKTISFGRGSASTPAVACVSMQFAWVAPIAVS